MAQNAYPSTNLKTFRDKFMLRSTNQRKNRKGSTEHAVLGAFASRAATHMATRSPEGAGERSLRPAGAVREREDQIYEDGFMDLPPEGCLGSLPEPAAGTSLAAGRLARTGSAQVAQAQSNG